MSAHGRWHRLFVYEVGEPYGPLSTDDFKDYDVEHGPDCREKKFESNGEDLD